MSNNNEVRTNPAKPNCGIVICNSVIENVKDKEDRDRLISTGASVYEIEEITNYISLKLEGEWKTKTQENYEVAEETVDVELNNKPNITSSKKDDGRDMAS